VQQVEVDGRFLERDAVEGGAGAQERNVEAAAVEGDKGLLARGERVEEGKRGAFLGIVPREVLPNLESFRIPQQGPDQEQGHAAEAGRFEVEEQEVFEAEAGQVGVRRGPAAQARSRIGELSAELAFEIGAWPNREIGAWTDRETGVWPDREIGVWPD
jgi:hypothetical protein